MQNVNWYDLQVLAALHRGGSVAAAARLLGIDQTTVGRRLADLQRRSGMDLLVRGGGRRGGGDGVGRKLSLTPAGREIAERACAMAREADAALQLMGARRQAIAGTVRLTAVPMLVNRLLAPATPQLLGMHPELCLELVPENRDLSLTRREADLALRLARPRTGGSAVKARRLASLGYAVFGPAVAMAPMPLPWIRFEEAMAHLPHAGWLEDAARQIGQAAGGLRVADAETALEAVAAGAGRTILPTRLADGDSRLMRMPPGAMGPPPERELWLLSHTEQPNAAAVRAVILWLEGLFGAS